MEKQKTSKRSVDYMPGLGISLCQNCKHQELPSCREVFGKINPKNWCFLFTLDPETDISLTIESSAEGLKRNEEKRRYG